MPIARKLRLIGVYRIPASSMVPTISPGDQILAEGFTYWFRAPRRGELVIFESEGLQTAGPATIYVKRVAGLPGETLRIQNGRLFVNDRETPLTNRAGRIEILSPESGFRLPYAPDGRTITIPPGQYFVLGDNSTNSSDSRIWGCVPRKNIVSRPVACFWPLTRRGPLK
jgi:signal peptidase I